MANICDNTFYAYSEDQNNLKVIEDFFEDWGSVDVEMNELYEKLPNKDDIDMRCLSVEYGCLYHALWICDKDGWRET